VAGAPLLYGAGVVVLKDIDLLASVQSATEVIRALGYLLRLRSAAVLVRAPGRRAFDNDMRGA
jgi:hypothetical protein